MAKQMDYETQLGGVPPELKRPAPGGLGVYGGNQTSTQGAGGDCSC